MSKIRLPKVERVNTPSGHRWEPPLDASADSATKLAWWAAITSAETGIAISLERSGLRFAVSISSPHGFTGINLSYSEAKVYLEGLADGVAFTRPTGTP